MEGEEALVTGGEGGNKSAQEPSDFPTIRLGDLKLAKEVRINTQSGVVGRQNRGACARRIYHAEIRRNPGTVTVAMYQGEGAEEEWRQHVAKYESIRHPNIIQLYGLEATEYIDNVIGSSMVMHSTGSYTFRVLKTCF
ncbi:hypothetical protein MSAN_01501700 [Mycena sanguinolenta]|uniref:Protein kinase domain-containing protein n=1 Tax=Mycena sanguinolenta TaxID=230812 RepID=A0A8H7CYS6_9AGAR|nr:hypothetical protein MSAN_01501700 [Mycena sanguinolenta]